MHAVTDAVHREYDRLSRNYDVRWRKYVDRTLCAVLEHLPCTGHDRVLDIACGTGELEHLLHPTYRWSALT